MDTRTTLDFLLSQTGGRIQIPLAEACAIAGTTEKTYRNLKWLGAAPFPASARPARVDVRDLAAFFDARRAGAAFHAPPAKPRATPRTPGEAPRRRGRPTKAEQAARAAAAAQAGKGGAA